MTDHYFSEQPSTRSIPTTVRLRLGELDFELMVDSGVFSSRDIDRGTRLLLEKSMPPATEGDLLDIGCGYGAIALALAKRYPDRRVWGIDVNERALELTESNARQLGLPNVSACKPDEVPSDVRFAGIFSNPPIRIGNASLHDLLLRWLRRLDDGGNAQLVVHKHLGSDSLAKWLELQGFDVDRISSNGGFRVLAVATSTS